MKTRHHVESVQMAPSYVYLTRVASDIELIWIALRRSASAFCRLLEVYLGNSFEEMRRDKLLNTLGFMPQQFTVLYVLPTG